MNEEIAEEIVNAHWVAFTNQDVKQDSEHEAAKKKADGYFLTSNEDDDDAEEKTERMENLGLDVIALTKNLWGENSTDFVVGLMVSITTESQLEALVEHLLYQIQKKEKQ